MEKEQREINSARGPDAKDYRAEFRALLPPRGPAECIINLAFDRLTVVSRRSVDSLARFPSLFPASERLFITRQPGVLNRRGSSRPAPLFSFLPFPDSFEYLCGSIDFSL